MAVHFSLEQLTRLRAAAKALDRQAATNEREVQQLLALAEQDRRDAGVGSATQIGLMRELCVHAREHHLATGRMITDLGDWQARPSGERSSAHAVLVVDDYEDSREWLVMVLQNAGLIVRTASDGLEALLAAHEMQPTVILMDLMMPVLDGVEATRLIKAHQDLRHIHVIAYTATPRPPKEELFSAVLRKPSPPDLLLASVQNFLVQ